MALWQPLSPTRVHHFASGCAFGVSEPGRLRQGNQDNLLIDEAIGLLMVGDGMGGHADGEVASRSALGDIHRVILRLAARLLAGDQDVDATVDGRHSGPATSSAGPAPSAPTHSLPIDAALVIAGRALAHANAHLHARNRNRGVPDGHGMGTTVTGLWRPHRDGPMVVFHVGDSRLYRWRAGRLRQLTTDHSVYQRSLAHAGMASGPPLATHHQLWQALGPSPAVAPQLQAIQPRPGDLYLLCTDGLHGMADDADIAAVLAHAAREHIPQTCAGLVALANRLGGRDNITALLMWCDR